MVLNVFALVLLAAKNPAWPLWPSLLALPIGWAIYALVPEQPWLINLPTLFFILGAILTLFLFTNRPNPSKV
jgi:hypothetical protein